MGLKLPSVFLSCDLLDDSRSSYVYRRQEFRIHTTNLIREATPIHILLFFFFGTIESFVKLYLSEEFYF